jgi:hypothetical protein
MPNEATVQYSLWKYEILLVLLVCAIPFLWVRPSYVVAKGDYFPYAFNLGSLNNDAFLWSNNNFGSPIPTAAYTLYGLFWGILQFLHLSVGLDQIILLAVQFAGAALSMIYLTKSVYPRQRFAAITASAFYIFNFFILMNLLNVGMMFTYSFLPLLIALFIKSLKQSERIFRNSLAFGIVFAIVASVSSINFADDVLIGVSLVSVFVYYLVIERKIKARRILGNLAVVLIITLLLSAWWIVPILVYYVPTSSTQLQSNVNVLDWSWTQTRASFMNLFWLNGVWGWRPEYVSYYNYYSNNFALMVLVFMPFLIAAAGLYFRDENRKLNAYLMLVLLLFLFLAKGLHEPFGLANLFLYNNVPFMNMFREPVSKFSMIAVPFLALLVGFAVDKIAGIPALSVSGRRQVYSKVMVVGCIVIFIVASFPILSNPIESKTEQIPFSSYVQIPQYWYDASKWLNGFGGDFRILITPLDDYYQIPYSWGYYGSDTFLQRLIFKSTIGPCISSAYVVNPDTILLINQLRDSIQYNRTQEFETLLSLLGVRFILERNDLDYEYMTSMDREIVYPEKMRGFLQAQPNVRFVRTIGKLDIYEYSQPYPYIQVFELDGFEEYKVEISNVTVFSQQWDFSSTDQFDAWKNATVENQFGAVCKVYSDDSSLRFEIWNSTWGWKTVVSPLIPCQSDARYEVRLRVKGQNTHDVHVKMIEYDSSMEITCGEYVYYVGDKSFDWNDVQISYVTRNESTKFLRIEIWSGSATPEPLPNIVWIDNVEIHGYITRLDTNLRGPMVPALNEDQPAQIVEYERLNPTRIAVKLEAVRPFVMVLNEANDQNWKLFLNGEEYDSVSVFSAMNGFLVNKTGSLELEIIYQPQEWFYWGCTVSISALIICGLIMIYFRAREWKKKSLTFEITVR